MSGANELVGSKVKERRSLDLGGSTIRLKYFDKSNKPVTMKMASRYLKISTNASTARDLKNKLDDFQIMASSLPETIGRYARGEATSYYDGVLAVVDNQELKVNQVATYVNAIHALGKMVLQLYGDNASVALKGKTGIVIPVGEYYSESAQIPKEKLSGKHTVYFPVVNKTVSFSLAKDNISIGGEGAVVLFVLRRDPKWKELIMSTNGIVSDVGYRSSDISYFQKFIADGKSARSFKDGGINMEATVSSELEKLNLPNSQSAIADAMKDGMVANKKVGHIVHKSKEIFGGTLRQHIVDVMAHSQESLAAISYVVPIGRPFIEGTSESNTGSLKEELVKGLREDVVVIKCGNLETANVDAMFELLG